MAERIRLTDERIRRFVFPDGFTQNQVFLWDDDVKRLAVRLTSSGAKAFIYEGKLNRQTLRRTIGDCSAWTLEDARKEARRIQTMIDQGIDPRELDRQKIAEKAALMTEAQAKKRYTLRALLEAYADHLDAQGKLRSSKSTRSIINVHVIKASPTLASKPASAVSSLDIAEMIRQTREKGKERTAGVLRSILCAAYNCGRRAAFDSGIPSLFIKFRIDSNPVEPIPTIGVNAGNRTLSSEELKKYLLALGDDSVDMSLKVALYSGGQRMAQLLRATISDWNPDAKTLRLFDPKGKRRTPREHLLPLAPEASGLITELINRSKAKGKDYLFPSLRNTPIHVSQPGPRVTEIAKKIDAEPFDIRDIRRTVETMLAGMGVSKDIRAQLLSHGISGVQSQHYDRFEYIKEKHNTLLKWERYLNRLLSGQEEEKIIPFPEVK